MNHYLFRARPIRRLGVFFGLAIMLAGCGTIATSALATFPATTSSLNVSPPSCPTAGMPANTTAFCISPAEIAQGETPIHFPSVPDSTLIKMGWSFTTAPASYVPKTTKSDAVRSALACAGTEYPGVRDNAAFLAQAHTAAGGDQNIPPAWIIDVTPVNPIPNVQVAGVGPVGAKATQTSHTITYILVTVNDSTGTCESIFAG